MNDKKRIEDFRIACSQSALAPARWLPSLNECTFILSKLDEAHEALARIRLTAGHPSASEGCRIIMNLADKALGEE